jgi:uracil-DNA glycosylase
MNINTFLDLLKNAPRLNHVFNPWRDYSCSLDIGPKAPELRVANLRAYLSTRLPTAGLLLIAEAPGYQGARFSGIAMTCERTLLGGKIGISPDLVFPSHIPKTRSSLDSACRNNMQRQLGYCEPTATYVWRELAKRPGAAEKVVLWNTFAFHPHKQNNPLSNRAPNQNEVSGQLNITLAMIALFPEIRIVAIGETAKTYLKEAGVTASGVRHPSYGGATKFSADIGPFFDGL